MENKNIMLAGGLVIAIVVLLGAGAWGYKTLTKQTAENVTIPTVTQTMDATTPVETSKFFKDGTYEAKGNYVSPGGPESIGVTLTIKDNVITDAAVVAEATLPKSQTYQKMFIESFKPEVVGKNLADLNLKKVSGSSLTPKGFNDALEKIKQEAT